MHQGSTNSQVVVDLTAYRKRRNGDETALTPEVHTDAEEAIKEIAQYLLLAVKVITSRRRQ